MGPGVTGATTLRSMSQFLDPTEEPRGDSAPRKPAGQYDFPFPDGTSAVWIGRATNRAQWLLAMAGAACLALGVDLAVEDSRWPGDAAPLVMAVAGCIAAGLLVLAGTLAFVHVVVRVDRHGVEVRCGHLGLPRRRIPWAEVDSVSAARVTPRHWGGWGYRWRPEKGTAVVVRRGPAVVFELGGGHRFTVTVDDAEDAVREIRERMRARAAVEPSGTA